MPIALRHRDDPTPSLAPLAGLDVHREHDADAMAALQGRAVGEMRRRLDEGHRAYVAQRDGEPAAYGWAATREAQIGELGASIVVPAGDRYLWNFVTLPAHRGLGVYPRLLDAIVRAEGREAARFWVAWAPENHASGAGIARAGFAAVAELSVATDGRAAVAPLAATGAAEAARLLALPAAEELAPCWRCVRAGRSAMYCAPGHCSCDYQRPAHPCVA